MKSEMCNGRSGLPYLRLRKGEELLFWILHKIMVVICFSAERSYNITYSLKPVQLCLDLFMNILIVISFLPGWRPINKAYLCFRMEKKYNLHSHLQERFKNI